jgi:uncharacterized protein (TIGR02271 family)
MDTTSQHTLIAVFRDQATAQAAINDLDASGFRSHETYDTGSAGDSRSATGHRAHEGGIVGWFKSLFGEEDAATTEYSRYQSAVQSGGVAVRVQTDAENSDRAVAILNSHSPVSLQGEGADQYANESAATDVSRSKSAREYKATDTGANRENTETIPVIREDLMVGKRVVQRGGVRVYARTINEPVEEQVRLREESVRVERTPVNREATTADLQPGREQVYEVKEFREEPVVSKQARVVEEVRVAKDARERVDTVRDSVRRTEVNVEKLSDSGNDAYRNRVDAGLEGGEQTGYSDSDPAYAYGTAASRDARYSGRSWDDVENDLRTDYSTRYPGGKWEEVKDSVRRGWEKVSAKAHGA